MHITPTDNSQTLTLFQKGDIAGAWVPEPWVSRLVLDGGGHVLQDEADLWPDGAFPTTVLLVRADFLKDHADVVKNLLQAHVDSVKWIADNPDKVADAVNAQLTADTGKALSDDVITRALEHVSFSVDPHAETFPTLVKNGLAAGTQKDGSIEGLFDLRILNGLLKASGDDTVSAAGLGKDCMVSSSARRASGVASSEIDGAAPGVRVTGALGAELRQRHAGAAAGGAPSTPPCGSSTWASASARDRWCSTTSTSTSRPASSSASSARPAAASRRC